MNMQRQQPKRKHYQFATCEDAYKRLEIENNPDAPVCEKCGLSYLFDPAKRNWVHPVITTMGEILTEKPA